MRTGCNGEPRLNLWNSNAELGAEMALKTHKTLPLNKALEAHVRAGFKRRRPPAPEPFCRK